MFLRFLGYQFTFSSFPLVSLLERKVRVWSPIYGHRERKGREGKKNGTENKERKNLNRARRRGNESQVQKGKEKGE